MSCAGASVTTPLTSVGTPTVSKYATRLGTAAGDESENPIEWRFQFTDVLDGSVPPVTGSGIDWSTLEYRITQPDGLATAWKPGGTDVTIGAGYRALRINSSTAAGLQLESLAGTWRLQVRVRDQVGRLTTSLTTAMDWNHQPLAPPVEVTQVSSGSLVAGVTDSQFLSRSLDAIDLRADNLAPLLNGLGASEPGYGIYQFEAENVSAGSTPDEVLVATAICLMPAN